MLPLRVNEGYSTFSKCRRYESRNQMVYCHNQNTRWVDLTPFQTCNRCILKLTGLETLEKEIQTNLGFWDFVILMVFDSPDDPSLELSLFHVFLDI